MKQRNIAIDLTDLAIGILILGITVTIGANILLGMRNSRLSDLSVITTVNETNTSDLSTGWRLTNEWFESLTVCTNASSAEVIQSDNYTVVINSDAGYATITNSTDTGAYGGNASMNCTYTFRDTTSPQWALPNNAAVGIAEYGNWFDIIVIVGIAGLILSLIFLAFGNRGQEQSGVSY